MKSLTKVASFAALSAVLALSALTATPESANASGDACSAQRANMIGAANDANRACAVILTDSAQTQCDAATDVFMSAVADYDACTGTGP